MSTLIKQPHQKELFGHPVGLYVLFFTEMWEAFFVLWDACHTCIIPCSTGNRR
jgi:hypothetical protein